MTLLANFLVMLVAFLHFVFCALEMFFWQRPLGLRAFKLTPLRARETATLAANQGLYNGFLAIGLVAGVFWGGRSQVVFCLVCIVVAGIYGAYSVNRKIFFIQALPALLALTVIAITDSVN